MNQERKPSQFLLSLVIILLIVAATIFLFQNRENLTKLKAFGYPGLFLLSILANATVIFPLPGVIVTSAMGAILNPYLVAIVAGSGAGIGEISGYLTGVAGKIVVENKNWYKKIYTYMEKNANWMIFILAFIPNPFFDLAGIAAGALQIPLWRFLIFCLLGKILKMFVFSYFGFSIMQIINR